jgi:hypothetical protein
MSRTALQATNLPSYSAGTIILCQGLQWLEHESDNSPLSSDEVKGAWSHRSTPPLPPPQHIFLTWCLRKRDQNSVLLQYHAVSWHRRIQIFQSNERIKLPNDMALHLTRMESSATLLQKPQNS